MRKDIIKPIETEYNGYLFRSKLEAQWAVVFDSLGIRYEYEPEGFELENGTKYLPDFYFPDQDTYGEVKPDRPGALEELFDKSLKFVENGTIERLIILPNIPAATKKDPVWWVPLIVKSPFTPPSFKDIPLSNLITTRAMIEKGNVATCGKATIKQIETAASKDLIRYTASCYEGKSKSCVIKDLRDALLQAIPNREMNYYIKYINEYEIMRAYKKARQVRFDHGQTPEAKRAG